MYDEKVILAVSSTYDKKFYFNEDFDSLPQQVKEELQIACVTYTEDVGGVLTIGFDEDGNLYLQSEANEMDLLFDEIGSHLKIKQMQIQKKELFEALEYYFKIFFLGEE